MGKTAQLPKIEENPASSTDEAEVFVMPCTLAQKRFWTLEQLAPGNTALSIPLAVQLSGPLRIDILEGALNAMVARHEVLRTSFAEIDGEPHQIIAAAGRLQLRRIELSDLAPEQQEERIRREMEAEAERPVDPRHAPLLRATLMPLGPTEHVLMLTAHHIISDGWSNGVLVRDLGAFYEALLEGKPVKLAPLTVQFADFAVWQEEWLKTPESDKQLAYWKEALSGHLPALDFPTDFTRSGGQDHDAILESLLLPEALSDGLKRLCMDGGATLFMVFYSAYLVLLRRYTGQTEFMLGTTAANRNKAELEDLIGLFANLLILRSDVSGKMSFQEFLASQREESLSSFANHEIPFEAVAEQLQERKTGSQHTLLQTHFLYQRAFMQPSTAGDLTIRPLRSVSPGSGFELTFGIVERKEGIRLQMEYRTSLFKASTIRRLLRHFQALLESIVANPGTPIDDLSLCAEEEHEDLEARLRPGVAVDPARPAFEPDEILKDLERHLETHLQQGEGPFTSPISLPPGAVSMALDAKMRLLPVGIPGEVYLGYPAGDLKRVMGDAPVSGPADVGCPMPLLRTGFIGRHGEDGGVELWGRSEDLVRLPVHRFNVRAVEARLRTHPEVLEAAVAFHPEFPDHTKLAAYVVLKPGAAATEDDLRNFLKGKISHFALPQAMLIVPELPKDAEGKVMVETLMPLAPHALSHDTRQFSLQGILQQQLIEIWQEILRTSQIGIHDNFFELGGNSLLAFRMMAQVGKLCGQPAPLSTLLTGATIANLSRLMIKANQDHEAATPVIPLQTRGTKAPLFFLHGDWAGGGFYCKGLAEELGEDQPFYVLPPHRSHQLMNLKEMAARHCAAIQNELPHGPYVLGGYCIGATLAMEMAQQLVAKGETVSHLILVDPPVWVSPWMRRLWLIVNRLGDRRGWDLEQRVTFFERYAAPFSRWWHQPLGLKWQILRRRLKLWAGSTVAQERDSGEEDVLRSLGYRLYTLSARLYQLKPLSVPATLYFPEATMEVGSARVARSEQLDAALCSVEALPGNHATCVAIHASVLAEKIRKKLGGL